MKTVIIVGTKEQIGAENIPAHWDIYNAPRPLYGKHWEGPFVTGKFYAAIDPSDEFSAGFVKENISLHANLVTFISPEDFNTTLTEYAADLARRYKLDASEFDQEDIESSFFNSRDDNELYVLLSKGR